MILLAHESIMTGMAHMHAGSSSPSLLSVLNTIKLSLFSVSYTHLRAHETLRYLVCRLLLENVQLVFGAVSYTHLTLPTILRV